jgi:phage terminase large subunit GpA-like protein
MNYYEQAFKDGLRPDPLLTVSEWADKHRFLSQKAASEPGRWRTSRTPYLKEIQDELSASSPTERIVFMKGAQVGGTEAGNNWLGYVIHHAPGPMLFVQPTVDMAKKLSKQRLAPMIAESPVLAALISPTRERDSGNTMLMKEFRGGVLMVTGANSAVGLRSMPIRYLFLDEVDAYPGDVDGEGDPVQLAERRTTTFARRKIFLVSTPTIKDVSRIEKEYLASDQRRFYVPCPHCDNMDWMRWQNIKWEGEDYRTATLACEACGCLIEEHHKTDMLNRGEWRATAGGDGTKGYHLSSLYSPLGWKSWASIVKEFYASKNDPMLLKVWVNTILGETWEEEYSAKIGAEALSERAEEYALLTVPDKGLLLTAGVDVQDNRLAVTVRAWGKDEESYLVNWLEIFGDPSDMSSSGPWAQVDNVLQQPYQRLNGGEAMHIRATAVDTGGHFTHEAYIFCRARKKRRVIAIKGSSTPGKPAIGKPSRQDVNFKNQTIKKGVDLWLIGTDTIKATIYGRLKQPAGEGAGVYHFPLGVTEEYYKQLTAEKQITKYFKGFPRREWIKKDGARNEALDCEVYAYAALQYFYTRVNRNTLWLQLESIIGKVATNDEPAQPVEKPVTVVPRTTNPTVRRRNGGFVKGFRG